jgi:hypothetical protein
MVSRAPLQTVLKKLNELEPRMRLGGHNMGREPLLLDDVMKAIEATIVEHVEKCETKPDWSTKVGGGASVRATGNYIFDKHNTAILVNDRSAGRFLEAHSDLSPLEIALTPEICKIFKYLSSCLHLAGVTGHSAGGSAEAFAQSTAPFEHDRPDGLESMSESFVKEIRRRLHIRILLSRMGCFTAPLQNQISSDSCIVSPYQIRISAGIRI